MQLAKSNEINLGGVMTDIWRRAILVGVSVLLSFCLVGCFEMSGTPPARGATDSSVSDSSPLAAGGATIVTAPPTGAPVVAGSPIPLAGNFSSVDTNIFIPMCTSCHSPPSPAGGYDMSSYATIMTGGYIVSLNPTASMLYTAVANNTMPPGNPLTAAEVQAISDWITAGANDDGPVVTAIPTPTPVPLTATFSSINANILQKSCISCHSGGGNDFNASSYVDVMRSVVAGNAAKSDLYDVISSGQMPPKNPLSTQEIQIIQTWINSGALDD